MKYQFVIRPIARRNLAAIERWYDERSEGLSDKFRVAFEETLERINRQPFRAPIIHKQTRRIEMHVYPYAVLYFVDQSDIFILRVLHTKRNPKRFMVDPNGK